MIYLQDFFLRCISFTNCIWANLVPDITKLEGITMAAIKHCSGEKGKEELTVSELEKKTGLRNVVPVVASLMAKGAVEVSEELKRGFMPKMQTLFVLPRCIRMKKITGRVCGLQAGEEAGTLADLFSRTQSCA